MRKGALQNGANPPNWALQYRGLLLALGFLLAAVGLAFGAVKAKNRADATGSMTIYLETSLSEQDLHALRKRENSMEFTAWGERLDVTVADPDLGRRIQTEVLVLDGSSELVLPLAPVLAAGDTGGCLGAVWKHTGDGGEGLNWKRTACCPWGCGFSAAWSDAWGKRERYYWN